MHSACAECAAPNSAKPKKAKIILRMSFKFLFLSYFSGVADTMMAAIIVVKTAGRRAFRREGCQCKDRFESKKSDELTDNCDSVCRTLSSTIAARWLAARGSFLYR
jgi:hypothetical protein